MSTLPPPASNVVTFPATGRRQDRNASAIALEAAAESAAGRPFDLDLVGVLDALGELMGFRLYTPNQSRSSRLYLSREDALDAWINRSIEWED